MDAMSLMPDPVVVQNRLARLAGVQTFEEASSVHDESRVGPTRDHPIALRNRNLELKPSSIDRDHGGGGNHGSP